jgi:hypothetical protein
MLKGGIAWLSDDEHLVYEELPGGATCIYVVTAVKESNGIHVEAAPWLKDGDIIKTMHASEETGYTIEKIACSNTVATFFNGLRLQTASKAI